MSKILLLLALFGCLISCNSTDPKVSTKTGAMLGDDALSAVAGTWKFSHVGPPSIQVDKDMPDPTAFAKKQLRGARISFGADGTSSMIATGKTMTFQAEVVEETPLYIRVGGPGASANDETYVYNKSTRELMLPMVLNINGSKGFMPAYFKRSRL